MNFPFSDFNVFLSYRTLASTNYPKNLHPHEPCLCCSNPYHSLGECPSWGQFSNFSCVQVNTNFSSQGFKSHSNSYTTNRNNYSDFSCYAQATRNYALQSYKLHYPEYSQLNNHSSIPSSYNHPPKKSLVQHFPTVHIDDLENRVNQLMAARHADAARLSGMQRRSTNNAEDR